MKKFLRVSAVAVCSVFLLAGVAMADAFTFGSGTGAALQNVLNGITTSPNPGASSVNVYTDALSDSADSYWNITGSGISGATIVIELGDYAPNNNFGVYNGFQLVQLFTGSAVVGNKATLSFSDNGDGTYSVITGFFDGVNWSGGDTGVDFASITFGYYLQNAEGNLFFSDTKLNEMNNGQYVDHMAAYQGKNIDTVKIAGGSPGLWTQNEYVLAWEDLYGGGDGDYEDLVIMVESVNPVPEPATMLLLGLGLLGIGIAKRRKN